MCANIYVAISNKTERSLHMKNYKEFLKFIKTNRVLSECVAEKLGISSAKLVSKLDSPVLLTIGEMVVLKQIFHLSTKDTISFFAPWVAYRNY